MSLATFTKSLAKKNLWQKSYLRRRLIARLRQVIDYGADREVIFRQIFTKELQRHQIEDLFFPVNSAASHLLLYFVLRACCEFSFKQVIELGSGQTTLLLDQIVKKVNPHLQVRSFENESRWQQNLSKQVSHPLFLRTLSQQTFLNQSFRGYHFLPGDLVASDFLIVDGPRGEPSYSRYSSLEVVATMKDEFLIVFDDAERAGERQTIDDVCEFLLSKNKKFKTQLLKSQKDLFVIASPAYEAALFF